MVTEFETPPSPGSFAVLRPAGCSAPLDPLDPFEPFEPLAGAVVSGVVVGEDWAEAPPLPPVRTRPAPAPAVSPARPMAANPSCFFIRRFPSRDAAAS